MTIISTPHITSIVSNLSRISNLIRCRIGVILCVLFFVGSQASGQSAAMHIEVIAPEWNQKKVCDTGSGYDPSPINAPSINYSGIGIKDAIYNYTWEQKKNDESWVVVNTEKSKTFIRSYNPAVLFNKKPGSQPDTYSWRLKVTDIANGNQIVETEVFSLTLASPFAITYKIVDSKSNKNKTTIDLNVNGGFSNKTYSWTAADRQSKFPASQINVEDPENLDKGIYQVTISDDCNSVVQTIDTALKSDDKSN